MRRKAAQLTESRIHRRRNSRCRLCRCCSIRLLCCRVTARRCCACAFHRTGRCILQGVEMGLAMGLGSMKTDACSAKAQLYILFICCLLLFNW